MSASSTRSEAKAKANALERLDWIRSFVDIPEASCDPDTTGLNPNQLRCIGDPEPYQACEKGRQEGHSFAFALDSIARAVLEPRTQSVHISTDKWEAQKKQVYALRILDSLRPQIRQFAQIKTESKERIELKNGSMIDFLACRPPRGADRAGIYLDEMAFMPNVTDILKAAVGCTTHGGYIRAGSTHCGALSEFYKIVRNQPDEWGNFPYENWSRGAFPWWTCPNLCVDVRTAMLEAPNMTTPERVNRFGNEKIKKVFKGQPILADFQEEYECMVVDEAHAFFPLSLLERCHPPKGLEEWFEQTEPAVKGKAQLDRAKTIIRMVAAAVRNGLIQGSLHAAMDIGRHIDKDELTIGSQFNNSMCLRAIISMDDMPFEQKEEIYEFMLYELPIQTGFIDATAGSMGEPLGEKLFAKHGQKAMMFPFNINTKAEIANNGKILMEKGQFIIPVPLPRLIRQFHSITKRITIGGRSVFDVEANQDHHGDLAWSCLMLLSLTNNNTGTVMLPSEIVKRENQFSNQSSDNPFGLPILGYGLQMHELMSGVVKRNRKY